MQIAIRHLVDIVAVLGLSLGVLGSLYLAYDLLGRPHGLLRILTGLLTFALAGALIFGPIYLFTNPEHGHLPDAIHLFTSNILYIGFLLGATTGISGGMVVFRAGNEAHNTWLAKKVTEDLARTKLDTSELESEMEKGAADLESVKAEIDEGRQRIETARSLLTREAEILKHATVEVYRHRVGSNRSKAARHLKRAKIQYDRNLAQLRKQEAEQSKVEAKYHQAKEKVDRYLAEVRERQQQIRELEADLTDAIERAKPRFRPVSQYFSRIPIVICGLAFLLALSAALILRVGLSKALLIAVVIGVLTVLVFALSIFLDILVRKLAGTDRIAAQLARSDDQPSLYSWTNFTVAFIYTFILQVPTAILINLASPGRAVLAALPFVLAGGLAGAISSSVFWWTDHVSERKLGIVGVILILIGFVIQLVPPILDLLIA